MPLRDTEVDDVLDTIEKHFSDRLSDWEAQFIESLQKQREYGKALSEKQKAKLDDVFERASNGGRG